jgi:PepSY-associated TM region
VRAYGVVRDSDGVAGGGPSRYANVLLDHTTGEVLHIDAAATDLSSHATRRWISGVHYVYFGGDAVRALLALLSLAGCATILTGNWIWLSRRKDGGSGARRPRLLARLTAGVGAGSFVAIAVLLVASRLIPLDAADRIAKEQQAFALALLACIAWALFARSTVAVWWRQLGLAGLLTLSLPLWAARLSSAGLFGGGPRIGTVVSVDVALLGVGALLLASAWAVRRAAGKSAAASSADSDPDSDSDPDPDPDPDRRRATTGLAKGTP